MNIVKSIYNYFLHLYLSKQKMKEIDISLVELIRNEQLESLQSVEYLETQLLPRLGLNNERPKMFPKELTGFGLYHCQYPIQFGGYLVLLSKLKINSYMEIGVRHGGTFIITNEYIKRFNSNLVSTAVDIGYSPSLIKYCDNKNSKFVQMNSQSNKFREYIKSLGKIDLVLVDADHTEDGCKYDYESVKDYSNIIVLHDISNDNCLGVKHVWDEIKLQTDLYNCYEFVNQYSEIQNRDNKKYLGIGVAVKKSYLSKNGLNIN